MRVQGLSGKGQMCFAECLRLGGVGVYELGDFLRVRAPGNDQLSLADQLAHPRADHVHSDDRPVGGLGAGADDLDPTGGAENLTLSVSSEVVDDRRDVSVLLACAGLG
ncbi:hypothetical protein EP51_28140 [Rhodococcus opacus]|uniref:Uncharacterized protein n=1 Tax=Rhodococcus opacus TaxID=37919 RepID=A0A076EQF8_RHOOP|nr:hypothetical protein EP51_28140 [Rhodococcus opacus]